jgi:GAF domain-containing protein
MDVIVAVLIGVAATVGLNHLWLWAGRRTEHVHLWVAAWCADTILFLATHHALLTTTTESTALIAARLSWMSGLAVIPILVGLSYALAGRRVPAWLMSAFAGTTVVLLLALWFTDALVAGHLVPRTTLLGRRYAASAAGPWLPVLVPYALLVFGLCVSVLRRASSLDRTERRAITVGTVVYVIAGVNDVLTTAGLIRTAPIFDFAFVGVALGLTSMLLRRYHRLHAHLQDEVALRTAELQARHEETAALVRTGKTVMAALELPSILDAIIREAACIARTSHVDVLLVDREAEVLRIAASAGRRRSAPSGIPLGAGFSGTVAMTGQPLFVPDPRNDPRRSPAEHDGADALGSYLGLPIEFRNEILGVLAIHTEGTRLYTLHEQSTLASFADQAAIAIDHARLYAAATERAQELAALHDVRTALVSTLDRGAVLDAIVQWATKLVGADAATIYELDTQDELLHARWAHDASVEATITPLALGQGAVGTAAAQRQPSFCVDVQAELPPGAHLEVIGRGRTLGALLRARPYRAFLAVPVLSRDVVLGAICVNWHAVHRPRDREIRLLTEFGQQAAVALENTRLYQVLEVRLEREEALRRLTRLISSSLDSDKVLGEITRAAAGLTGAPVAMFWGADEHRRVLEAVSFSDALLGTDFPERQLDFDQGLLGWIAAHREPLTIPDVTTDPRAGDLGWWRRHGLTSFHGVPVVLDGSLLGVLALNGRHPFRLGPDEQALLESFVAQAAIALRNAALHQAEGAARRQAELALAQVQQLQGMLPICAYCRRVRDDRNYWQQIETYVAEHTQATFSHGICPDCRAKIVDPELERWRQRRP